MKDKSDDDSNLRGVDTDAEDEDEQLDEWILLMKREEMYRSRSRLGMGYKFRPKITFYLGEENKAGKGTVPNN